MFVKKEQYYYQKMGVKKNILNIAIEHNFVKKKEQLKFQNIDIIKEFEFCVFSETRDKLYIGRKELLGEVTLAILEKRVKKEVVQKSIPVREFERKFKQQLLVDDKDIEKSIKQFNAYEATDSDVLEIFNMVLEDASQRDVSDIHINSYKEFSWLRYRTDGVVDAKFLINSELSSRFSTIIKEQSSLDLINTTIPQSGSFSKTFNKMLIDFRVEIAPAQYGENVVIRLLNKSSSYKDLKAIFPKNHKMYEHINYYANEKNGFFLLVGPTGSGKTTTLNAMITQRQRVNEIIYSIEDPIEYKIDFITQYEVKEELGFTFATAMKSVMRQDPDVIMIGEMRDKQSIESALKASHSGHMVFSTLHASNALMAIQRIKDEDGDLFVLAYSLSGVIAQRLIPKLCTCKVKSTSNEEQTFFNTKHLGYEKKGCSKCNFSGFKGRTLLCDMLFIPHDMSIRGTFYEALKSGNILNIWDRLITFNYYESATYLYESGLCDAQTLQKELLSLGYVDG
ncbi:MAG: ATPase, T2SS/T4P/T4SS family, partial [Campylobacterota bacterium]|nr:ATPase, T2SS/T4P/T4SS family [Campylobacterota bacterium]